MSANPENDGVLGRWARRKADVKREAQEAEAALPPDVEPEQPQAEPDTEEGALELLRERDPELAEQIAAIDIDKLVYEDDFSVFMNTKVPEFIRRRALSKLWLLNPILANLDGLNDYDDDFTDAATVLKDFKSAYMPGSGYAFIADEPEKEAEAVAQAGDETDDPSRAESAADAAENGDDEIAPRQMAGEDAEVVDENDVGDGDTEFA